MSERFQTHYAGPTPPWDIPRAQRAVVALADLGEFVGPVLDLGCGTGENALYLASLGFHVTGLDFVEVALEKARAKATDRELAVTFQQADALDLPSLKPAATILDCGLFHVFSDEERPRYLTSLRRVSGPGTVLHLLCFSDQEPGEEGPRRIHREELFATFTPAWEIERIRATRFESHRYPEGARAWLATMRRTPC